MAPTMLITKLLIIALISVPAFGAEFPNTASWWRLNAAKYRRFIVFLAGPEHNGVFTNTGRWWNFGTTEEEGLGPPPGRQGSFCNVIDMREEPNGQGTDIVGFDVGVTATDGTGITVARPFEFQGTRVGTIGGVPVGVALIQQTDFIYTYLFFGDTGYTTCFTNTPEPTRRLRFLCRTLNFLLLRRRTIDLRLENCPGYPASTLEFDLSLLSGNLPAGGKYFHASDFGNLPDFSCAYDIFTPNAASNKKDYTSTRIVGAQPPSVVTGTIEQDNNWSGRYTETDTGTTDKVPRWVVLLRDDGNQNGVYSWFVSVDPARNYGTILVHENYVLSAIELQDIKTQVAASNPTILVTDWVDIDNVNQCS